MTRKRLLSCIALAASLTCTSPVWAHPGHLDLQNGSAFIAGLLHPLTGLDHILAMVAVGLLAFNLGGRALWAIPASFIIAMIGGGALAIAGVHLPMVESAIATSVLVIGLLVAMQTSLSTPTAALIVASFALFHGHAHGTEMPGNASAFGYVLGFITATAALHASGILAAIAASKWSLRYSQSVLRITGGLVAAAGLALTASTF